MNMLNPVPTTLRDSLAQIGDLSGRSLCTVRRNVAFSSLVRGSSLESGGEDLRGGSILIATRDQFTAALALVALDGVAGRLVLCPPDVRPEHLPWIIDCADVDTIVSDRRIPVPDLPAVRRHVACRAEIVSANPASGSSLPTEWILLTSGTTGVPKLVAHTLDSLAGAITRGASADGSVWSTFYDIRRYGGLQIFLRAVLTGSSLVFSDPGESTSDFLKRASEHGVTHISGTPSHWRRALMSDSQRLLQPRYVRLSGEIADEAVLNQLHAAYPRAAVAHAFATTEAGVAFEVNDGRAGFPASRIGQNSPVELKVEDGSLRIRSNRMARRYLGHDAKPLAGLDGFVDTGDMISLRGDRYYFCGRRDGVINVGGLKVHPEEVEAVINRHPLVYASMVRAKKNPVTGAVVTADIVLKTPAGDANGHALGLPNEILGLCREALPPHKVPALVNFVPSLGITEAGKLMRNYA